MYSEADKKIQKQKMKDTIAEMKRLVGEGNMKEAVRLWKVWGMHDDYDDNLKYHVRQAMLKKAGITYDWFGSIAFDGLTQKESDLVYRFGYDIYWVKRQSMTIIESALYREREEAALRRVVAP